MQTLNAIRIANVSHNKNQNTTTKDTFSSKNIFYAGRKVKTKCHSVPMNLPTTVNHNDLRLVDTVARRQKGARTNWATAETTREIVSRNGNKRRTHQRRLSIVW
ncbi:hypothetical protein JTE90_020520 [Oedothorax gibbosus]|uniref:Uncharacterized protein n=1 Tax=Oedothorax gibbosus TaxID=931172 RepID=A0AAV6TZQ0_9ARAC|nr:hypothetical protein JTE90_020520 [Oedothorax gibbosus]